MRPADVVIMPAIDPNATQPVVPPTLSWSGETDGCLKLIDQTQLPADCPIIECRQVEQVWDAIRRLRVRGAPAIGVAAAYGVVLGLQAVVAANGDNTAFDRRLDEVRAYLASSRPTAVNLFAALNRMRTAADASRDQTPHARLERLLDEAQQIELEDQRMCAAIGNNGAPLLVDHQGVLTHCNTGALATAGMGTALAVIFAAAASGKRLHVYADETRPLLQGARLTTWELMQRGIPVTLICDSAAAWVMKEKRVNAVITGADRIAANGDAANKIGTYALAILAARHEIPFYVAAPSTTFDLSLADGNSIPIEERDPGEITAGFGRKIAPANVAAYNPAFDVTPAEYITAIITERGVIEHPTRERIRTLLH